MSPKIRFAIVQKENGGLQYVDFETVIGLNLAEGDIRLLDYNNRDFSIKLDMNGNVKYTKGKKLRSDIILYELASLQNACRH